MATYTLKAPFTGDFQGYADEQLLDSSGEGITTGSLTVIENDGTATLMDDALRLADQATAALGDLGAYGAAVTRAYGIALACQVRQTTQGDIGSYLWWSDATGLGGNDRLYAMWMDSSYGLVARVMDANGNVIENIISGEILGTGETYEFAIVLGGYDSSGVPYQSGATTNFTYGASWYVRGGDMESARLFWRAPDYNTATLYPNVATYDADCEYHDISVTEADADYIIPAEVYAATTSASDTFTHSANAWIEFTATRPSADGISIHLRRQDATNYIAVTIDYQGAVSLYKVIDGTSTQLGTTGGALAESTATRVIVTLDGSRIRVYKRGTTGSNLLASGTETTLVAATGGKINALGTGGVVAKLASYPLTSASDPIADIYGSYSILRATGTSATTTLRSSIRDAIWSGNTYPSDGIDSAALDQTDPLATYSLSPSNLEQVDIWTVAIDNGSGSTGDTRYPIVWRPTAVTSNGKAVIYHCGHTSGGTAWNAGGQGAMVKALVEAGYTVVGIYMPGPAGDTAPTHNAYPDPTATLNYLRYFVEPTIRSINELVSEGFTLIFMCGISGGGWTTNMAAACDERIDCWAAVAGSFPLYMLETNRDWEQMLPGLGSLRLDYTDLYAMGCSDGRTGRLYYNDTEALFDKATYDASREPFESDVAAAATAMGGDFDIYWDSNANHEISSTVRGLIVDLFDAWTEPVTATYRNLILGGGVF